MKIQQIRDIARERGLNPGRLGKVELIRAIQRDEGSFDCFATTYNGVCDQYQCLWREDCFATARRAAVPTPGGAESGGIVLPLARRKRRASR